MVLNFRVADDNLDDKYIRFLIYSSFGIILAISDHILAYYSVNGVISKVKVNVSHHENIWKTQYSWDRVWYSSDKHPWC